MNRCLELAKKGAGYVSPNPMVGCVIVKNGKVIAEDYHRRFGGAHAEINALKKAGERARGATMYVNLEPCFHYGKTPPCVDEIIKRGIKRVVIGTKDPNPLVAGRSMKKLRPYRGDASSRPKPGLSLTRKIEVIEGVLEDECRELNKFFFKYIRTGLPYVTLKAALTLDGKIANEKGRSRWISSFESRKLVHRMRSEYDAVLVGKRTVEIDDPSLTVRHVKGRNPVRVVIDKDLKLDSGKKVFNNSARTIAIANSKNFQHRGTETLRCNTERGKINLSVAMRKLGKMGIASVLVEGGAKTISEFLRQGIADEIRLFIAPKVMGKGVEWVEEDVTLNGWQVFDVKKVGKDVMMKIKYQEWIPAFAVPDGRQAGMTNSDVLGNS